MAQEGKPSQQEILLKIGALNGSPNGRDGVTMQYPSPRTSISLLQVRNKKYWS